MMREVTDSRSGAILFKRSKESLRAQKRLQDMEETITSYEKKLASLEKKIKKIESLQKENS